MRIGIEISTLANHGHDIGAGRYIFNLVDNLLDIDTRNRYTLVGRYTTGNHLKKIDALAKSNAKLKLFKASEKSLRIWDRVGFPPYELLGFRADVFHCPDFMVPPTWARNIVLTINDLAFVRFPEFNFEWFIEKYTRLVKANAMRAQKIIAISKSTRNDIIEFFGVPPDKVSVIYPAADGIFKKLKNPDASVPRRYNTGNDYILSVGTVEPRKNYPLLINAFGKIKGDFPRLKLVIVGRTGWKSEPSYKAREDSPHREDILFLGRIEDSDLVHLYNQAKAFVYPSLFEGFGLPVLEAMSCGAAVIASNTSSLPEVTADS
ncbi:MAG: glycosyltransferase family 4 protein, partial [Actinomycetota bacterium]